MIEFRITWQKFWTPSQSYRKLFEPSCPSHVNWKNLEPLHLMQNVLLKQWGNFLTPLKRNTKKIQPPSSRSLNIFDSLPSRPSPYCWIKNDQPLFPCVSCLWSYLFPLFSIFSCNHFSNILWRTCPMTDLYNSINYVHTYVYVYTNTRLKRTNHQKT